MPAYNRLARATMLALVVVPGCSWAGDFAYAVFASVEHSDNIALSTSNPASTNVFTPGVNFAYRQVGSTIQANIVGTAEYLDYSNKQFDSQTLGSLSLQANWTAIPERLDFSIEDDAGVQPVDTLTSNAPDNQQQTNVLSLGPILHFNFNEATRGQAELKYMSSYASKVDDFDSSRGLGALRIIRDVSPTTQVSLNLESQRVDLKNSDAGPDYTRNEFYGHYVHTLRDFDVDALLGWGYVDFSHEPSASKPMARVTLGWRPSVDNSFSLTGTYEFSDAAQDMLLQPGQTIIDSMTNVPTNPLDLINDPNRGINTGSVVVDSQVYLDQSLQGTYSYRGDRLSVTVAPLYRKLDYLNDSTFDQKEKTVAFSVEYKLRPTLLLTTFGDFEHIDYSFIDRTDKTYRYGAALSHEFTQHWSWRVSYQRQLRHSTADDQSYHENEILFAVVYRR
ncbi:outer membrane beta-barrel protein [Dyella sp. C11]|uniref:outer membrane beta-barrel protein n=1 Tax=Dyella sp. C11 TaxID=2126991 RepID=UPI00130039DE|nr:outer membrane beta-barrel protein [Dyella sp. C11]